MKKLYETPKLNLEFLIKEDILLSSATDPTSTPVETTPPEPENPDNVEQSFLNFSSWW